MASNTFITKSIAFQRDVEKFLFPENSWAGMFKDKSSMVAKNGTLRIPLSAGERNVRRGHHRNGGGAGVIQQKHLSELIVTLEDYSTEPELLTHYEKVFNYADQSAEIIEMHAASIKKEIHRDILRSICGARTIKESGAPETSQPFNADHFIKTTGDAVSGKLKLSNADFQAARELMNLHDYPYEGRMIIIHPSLEKDLWDLEGFIKNEMLGSPVMQSGVIGRLQGFNVYLSTLVPYFDVSGSTPVMLGLNDVRDEATDNPAAIFLHRNAVSKAISKFEYFNETGSAVYQGDIDSALMYAMGFRDSANNDGVYIVVQDND